MPTRGPRKRIGEKKPDASIVRIANEALALNVPPSGAETAVAEDWMAPSEPFASIKDAQLYQKRIDANLKLVYYKRVTGELIETNLIKQAAGDIGSSQKDLLYSFIDTAAPELAALTDPKLVRAYLREKMPLLFGDLETLWFSALAKA